MLSLSLLWDFLVRWRRARETPFLSFIMFRFSLKVWIVDNSSQPLRVPWHSHGWLQHAAWAVHFCGCTQQGPGERGLLVQLWAWPVCSMFCHSLGVIGVERVGPLMSCFCPLMDGAWKLGRPPLFPQRATSQPFRKFEATASWWPHYWQQLQNSLFNKTMLIS